MTGGAIVNIILKVNVMRPLVILAAILVRSLSLNISPHNISVSGVSSGACFATQLHTAFSATVEPGSRQSRAGETDFIFQISGMGSVAGAPYLSAYEVTEAGILDQTLLLADQGLIDPVENLKYDQVFIFQGLIDTVVPWGKTNI